MSSAYSTCQNCGEPLTPGGVCAACAFGAVLAVPDIDATADSWLGETDTPQFSLPGKMVLPARFGEYDLRREIAVGGMGVVYEAWHARARRTVALKMVRGAGMASSTELARFRVEAEAAAQLDHPNIVPIHEIGDCDGQPFYTMKLIGGMSLAQRLKREKSISPRETATLMAATARAVHHAHQRGVLHRDLKPGNILLDEQQVPWLTDFGLARITDAESGLTLSSAHLGTPHYMSPEQAAGRIRDVSTASDVWALGIILYQMLSGRVPFPGTNAAEVMRRIVEHEAPSLSGDRGSRTAESRDGTRRLVDRDLATIVSRCLEKDPLRRMSSALTLAEELELWLAGQPIRLRPVTGMERAMKWCRRHPGRVAAMAAVTLSICAGTVSSLVLWRRAVRHADEARTARDSAAEDAYFATVANAFSERSRFDFASARKLLATLPAERRGFEWRLVDGLCRGDETWTTPVPGAPPRLLARDPSKGIVWLLSEDRSLHRVDAATGALESAGKAPAGDIPPQTRGFRTSMDFAFAPDGLHYFTINGPALVVAKRDTHEPVFSRLLPGGEAAWLDSATLIYGQSATFRIEEGKATAWTWDLTTRTETPMPAAPIAGPFAIAPDRSAVAWMRKAADGYRIILRRPERIRTGEPDAVIPEQGGPPVSSMAFSADGKTLSVAWNGDPNGKVSLYEIPGGRLIRELPVPPQSLVACGPDSPHTAIAGQDLWISLLHPEDGSEHTVFDDGNQGLGDFYDADRPLKPPMRLLTRSVQSGRVRLMFGHEAPPQSIAFLPGEKSLLTTSPDGTVRRWPLKAAAPSHLRINNILTLHHWFHPAASPDGSFALCRDVDNGTSFIQRFGSSQRVGFSWEYSGVACFDDGRVLLRHAAGHTFSCWQTTGEEPEQLWEVPCGRSIQGFSHISHSSVTRDGRLVAVLMPGKIVIVDMHARTVRETGDQVMEYGLTPGQTIALSPDGTLAAVTGFAGMRARLYRTEDPAAGHQKVEPATQLTGHDTACAFSRDGTRLFVGNEDGMVRVFLSSTRQELPAEAWKAHSTPITALAVSDSGEIIATAAEGSLALWSASASGPRRQRLRMPLDRARNWIAFPTDDTAILHSAPDRPLEKWPAPDR